MPGGFHSLDGNVKIDQITTQIATIQDSTYPEAEHELPNKDIEIPLRDNYRRHELVGLNVFLLEMFNQFDRILGVDKSDFMTSATNGNQLAVENMLRQARHDTVALHSKVNSAENGLLEVSVTVTNKVGHRFPSGVSFRRAFLELLVIRDFGGTQEQIVWGSGRTNAVGVIVDGNGQPLKTEFLDQTEPGRKIPLYQPHHQTITREDQVQIYEELVLNAKNAFTTSFIHRNKHPKDNRLLPFGYLEPGTEAFKAKFGDSEIISAFMKATRPEGLAGDIETCPPHDASTHCPTDSDFQPGQDIVNYHIELPAGITPTELTVKATMYYQAIPPYWLQQRFSLAPEQPATQRLYYLTSHLNTQGTPIENWKLPLISSTATIKGDDHAE